MKIHPLTWIKAHPFKAVLFTALLVLSASLCGSSGASWPVFAVVYGVPTVCWFCVLWRDSLVLLLIASLVPAPRARAQVLPAVITVTVVVVGGVVVYKLNKYCQRKFSKPPANTNDPPEFSLDGPATDGFGATYSYSANGSCWAAVGLTESLTMLPEQSETAFNLMVTVDDSGELPVARTDFYAVEAEEAQGSWDDLETILDGWGLYLSPYGGGAASYGRNGLPCDAVDVPISFDSRDGTVTVDLGGPLFPVLIEASHDLQNWEPVLRTVVSVGVPLSITDTSKDGMTIYRVSVQ